MPAMYAHLKQKTRVELDYPWEMENSINNKILETLYN